MPTWFLLLGLVAIFLGTAAVIVIAGSIGREKAQVSSSLAAIEALSGPVPDDMRRVYDKPFNVRVTQPVFAALTNASRTLVGANWNKNTTRRLAMAGNPPGWDADRLLAWKMLAALLLTSIVGGLLFVSGRPLQALVLGVGFGVFGFFLPDLLVLNTSQHRSESIRKSLPDSIDLLTVCVESGLAFDAAMAQVARNTEGPLAEEFARVLREIQIGSGRSDALRALSDRTDVAELQAFLNSMVQAEKLGIPIADVLRVQAAEIRLKRTQRVEEQAMKLPVKIINIYTVLFETL
jgi:tight adherence protein C